MIKVSVIVPVYNASLYLEQCLDSIVQQTLREIEIILIDDGSTDESFSILQRYAAEDERIKLIRQQNSGAGAARNKGMKIAAGKYLSFLDADDFFEPDMLEKAFNRAEIDNADIVVFESDKYYTEEDAFRFERTVVREEFIPPYRPFSYRQLTGPVFRTFVGWAWDKLFRKSFIDENNLEFQELRSSEDLYFVYSSIVLAKKITVCYEVLIHYRCDVANSISNTREKSWWCCYEAMMELKRLLIKSGKYEELKRDFSDYAVKFITWNYNTLREPAKSELLDKLLSGWFEDLDMTQDNIKYFTDKEETEQFLQLIKTGN